MSSHTPRFEHAERWLSILVGLSAIIAVSVSLYQAALARRQARAAAWPYISQSNSLNTDRPYTRAVANQGVGPARIRTVQVFADSQPVARWRDAIRALTGADQSSYTYSDIGTGSVLSPGTADTLLTLAAGPQAVAFWRAAQTRLRVVICYCSVYDECWIADDGRTDPEAVPRCPPLKGRAFAE